MAFWEGAVWLRKICGRFLEEEGGWEEESEDVTILLRMCQSAFGGG